MGWLSQPTSAKRRQRVLNTAHIVHSMFSAGILEGYVCIYIWEPSVKADNKFMNWCVYSALRDCQNLHRDRLSDWLAIGYTATTTTTTTTTTPATTTPTPGITVSFPDRFRTAQFSFLLKYENECVHGRILLLVLLLFSVLPLAPLSLQRRY